MYEHNLIQVHQIVILVFMKVANWQFDANLVKHCDSVVLISINQQTNYEHVAFGAIPIALLLA